LAVVLAVPALGAPPLEWSGQVARVTDAVVDDEGIHWRLEVRDTCATEVKKAFIEIPCSEWRAALVTDSERTPAAQGKIDLPDGKKANLGNRSGTSTSGEQHKFVARLTASGGVSQEFSLTGPAEDGGTGGMWTLAGTLPADLMASGILVVDGDWEFELEGGVDGIPVRWDPDDSLEESPASVDTLPRRTPTSVAEAAMAEASAEWLCGTVQRLAAAGSFDPVEDPQALRATLAFDRIRFLLEQTQAACPDQAQLAVDRMCGLVDRAHASLDRDADPSRWLAAAEAIPTLAELCPATAREDLAATATAAAAALLDSRDRADLPSYVEVHGTWLGEEWRSDLESRWRQAIDDDANALLDARDHWGLSGHLAVHGTWMGEPWRSDLESRWRPVIDEDTDALVATGALTAAAALVESVSEVMGVRWTAKRNVAIDAAKREADTEATARRIAEIEEDYASILAEPLMDREVDWDLAKALIERMYAIVVATASRDYAVAAGAYSREERWKHNRIGLAVSLAQNTSPPSARRAVEVIHRDVRAGITPEEERGRDYSERSLGPRFSVLQRRDGYVRAGFEFPTGGTISFAWDPLRGWCLDRIDDVGLAFPLEWKDKVIGNPENDGLDLSDLAFTPDAEAFPTWGEEIDPDSKSRGVGACREEYEEVFRASLAAPPPGMLGDLAGHGEINVVRASRDGNVLDFSATDHAAFFPTFEEAATYCANLEVAGTRGWQIPQDCWVPSSSEEFVSWCTMQSKQLLAHPRGSSFPEQLQIPESKRRVSCEKRFPDSEALLRYALEQTWALETTCSRKLTRLGFR